MASKENRIVFLQYTNPAAYPPLEHASRILADAGRNVTFLAGAVEPADTRTFPPHERIRICRFPTFGGGLARRLNYIAYVLWVLWVTLRDRPAWVYASDPLSTPAAVVACLVGSRLAYHEHDSPGRSERVNLVNLIVRMARNRVARRAELCILPQAQRLSAFVSETGRQRASVCVLNVPKRSEVSPPRATSHRPGDPITFYYHGSLNALRLPLTVLDALARLPGEARLDVVGYETIGSIGYMQTFMQRTRELGLSERVRYLGSLSLRSEVMAAAARADVGFSFMPANSDDINMRHMAGASNKPFDYMAVGLMLLVSDMPEWREMFVAPGFARACDPGDVTSLANAMKWCAEHPAEVRSIGEACRARIAETWNYEASFAPVQSLLSSSAVQQPPVCK